MEFLRRTDAAQLAKKYKLIGFGAGSLGAQTQHFLDGKISYFLDNEKEKWGKRWEGVVPVEPPSVLDEEDLLSAIIIVCSEQYKIVGEQLQFLYPNIKLMRTPLLKEYEIFDILLNCSQMLLVSAYGANGGIYLVNGRTGGYQQLTKGSFRGLLLLGDRLIAATEKGELWELQTLVPFSYRTRYTPETICQMHGLAYWEKDDVIIAAEAEYDSISFFDASTFKKVDHFSITEKVSSSRRDNCHINDLHVRGDSLFISLLSRSGWWKQGIYDGCICELDLNTKKDMVPVITNLLFPHSIKFIDDSFYILEAMNSRLLSGRNEVILQLNGFIRGLDGNHQVLYIGQSRNRRIKEAVRYHSPVSMDSGIYVVSPETKVFRFVKMPEMCDIYNIIDLSQKDSIFLKGLKIE